MEDFFYSRKNLKEIIYYEFVNEKQISNLDFLSLNDEGFIGFTETDVSNILHELYDEGKLEFNKQLNYLKEKSYKIQNFRYIKGK
ncbi:MAG: hypothetical protein KC455_03285 [Carnobacterium sp.]|nr:hypothetical protein [Carnobacterium sp.]